MAKRHLLFVAAGLFATPCLAGRSVIIPPVTVQSVHGGALPLGTGTQVCVTANMAASLFPGGNDGVRSGLHFVAVNLANISSIDQTVNMVILAGSAVSSSNSGGNSASIPLVAGPTLSFTNDYVSGDIVIPPNGEYSYGLGIHCHDTLCKIEEAGPAAGAVIKGTFFNTTIAVPCDGVPQACISLASNLHLKVVVKEDRGAIQAHVTTQAHRCNGFTDSFSMPPYSIFVNGGRPF